MAHIGTLTGNASTSIFLKNREKESIVLVGQFGSTTPGTVTCEMTPDGTTFLNTGDATPAANAIVALKGGHYNMRVTMAGSVGTVAVEVYMV